MNTPKSPPKIEAIPNNDTSITTSNIPEVKTAPSKYEIQLERSIAEVATCLWDINRKLHNSETTQHDRKLRLAKRRVERAILSLEEIGIAIDDPIGRRYAAGSEGSMQPNFQPTSGISFEQIVETIAPIVYWNERLIGRGEVFVAIPIPANQNAESVPAVNNESNLIYPLSE